MKDCWLLLSMTNCCFTVILLVFFFSHCANAQETVTGKIFSSATDSIISSASITNKNIRQTVTAIKDGSYSIRASEGDTLIFSAIGFVPDTVAVQFFMLISTYDVTLQMKIISLENVKVSSNYQQDSLMRRNYYKSIYKKQPGITGFNGPADGVGITLSPISYFSKKAKEKRVLKKRLIKQEKETYIDFRFPADWVKKLTGLSGDSLSLFLYRYRPSYDFCRKTDGQGMIIYINDQLKEFRKPDTKR